MNIEVDEKNRTGLVSSYEMEEGQIGERNGDIVLRAYDIIVSLKKPGSTYPLTGNKKIRLYQTGTKITIIL